VVGGVGVVGVGRPEPGDLRELLGLMTGELVVQLAAVVEEDRAPRALVLM